MAVDTDLVRTHLRADHEETLGAVADCADATVEQWDGPVTTDPSMITDPLESCLREAGEFSGLLNLLRSGVVRAGYSMPADPVAAPPYLTITSLGPVLRGTVSEGRLVISVSVFEVQEIGRYRRTEEPYRLSVEWIPDGETL